MRLTNPFTAGGFDVISMTMAINRVPVNVRALRK